MDTRSKIIPAQEAEARLDQDPALLAVRLDLDPLYAPQAAALAAFARPLVLVVAPIAGEYLSVRARAEMAASLACVRYVVAEEVQLPGLVDLREREAQWIAELEQTVLTKSAVPEAPLPGKSSIPGAQ